MKTCQKIVSLFLSVLLVFGTVAAVGNAAVLAYAVDGAASESGETASVKAKGVEGEITIGYLETKYFEFEAENLPEGASVHVFLNGEDQGDRTYFYVNDPTGDYTVEAKVIDQDGQVIAVSGEIRVTVQNGFVDRVKAIAERVSGTLGDVAFDIFSSIFMKIWAFLHR